jgi:molecular chaperone HtpG
VKKLAACARVPTSTTWPQVLFDNALLAEGGQLEDPAAYVRRIQALILG